MPWPVCSSVCVTSTLLAHVGHCHAVQWTGELCIEPRVAGSCSELSPFDQGKFRSHLVQHRRGSSGALGSCQSRHYRLREAACCLPSGPVWGSSGHTLVCVSLAGGGSVSPLLVSLFPFPAASDVTWLVVLGAASHYLPVSRPHCLPGGGGAQWLLGAPDLSCTLRGKLSV